MNSLPIFLVNEHFDGYLCQSSFIAKIGIFIALYTATLCFVSAIARL